MAVLRPLSTSIWKPAACAAPPPRVPATARAERSFFMWSLPSLVGPGPPKRGPRPWRSGARLVPGGNPRRRLGLGLHRQRLVALGGAGLEAVDEEAVQRVGRDVRRRRVLAHRELRRGRVAV